MSDDVGIALGIQLAAAAGLMVLMTLIHTLGLVATSRMLDLRQERLRKLDFSLKSIWLTCAMGVSLLALHTVEIAVFAGFYIAVEAMTSVEEALYYSASAYATLGRTADYFPADWRLIGAVEALIGFLLIGWSTAFIVSKGDRLTPG